VTLDPADEAQSRVQEQLPGVRFIWDFDGAVSRLYGSIPKEAAQGSSVAARQFWMVLDPTLRVLAAVPFSDDAHEQVFGFLAELPPPDRFVGFEVFAPVLVLHSVFEADLCDKLIGLYEAHGGEESGFMRDVGGKTVLIQDPRHKKRRDFTIEDQPLIELLQRRILRRVNPEMKKAYSYSPTRMERYIVSCYAAEDQGHFRAHRDNTTKGTAHRRFAISINLNDDFDGGELSFPEYGGRSYKAPRGGAVVFSGALLHAVSSVTRGRRYAFLPFVYDEEAAKIREANAKFLEGEAANYKAQGAPR
jgi:predicted 2-oxoglutarate/Fe(II)-dependent dioxygenase YbiX